VIPIIKQFWHDFFYNGTFFVRTVRASLGAFALGGMGFADDLARELGDGSPGLIKAIRVSAVVSGFLAFMLGAGDKTTPEKVTEALARASDAGPTP